MKFSLDGDRGLDIFATGSPSTVLVACDTGAPVDPIEETVTANTSSLSYNPATDTYTYTWKTTRNWADTCRDLILRFTDGSVHTARFLFN